MIIGLAKAVQVIDSSIGFENFTSLLRSEVARNACKMIAATQSNHPLANIPSKSEVSNLEAACARLRQAQMRVTKPRIAILEALIRRDTPVSIENLHQELSESSCDLVTVYRCLAAFEELGLVRRSFQHNGTGLYEFAHTSKTRHYHVLCKVCGKSEPVEYFSVEGMERLLTERGFTQLSHIVEFFGICPTCQVKPAVRQTGVSNDMASS